MLSNNDQKKIIHTLKFKMNLPDLAYLDMLAEYNVQSSKYLTFVQAKKFIQTLSLQAERMGVWKTNSRTKKYESLSNRSRHMASPAQLRMIEAMWKDVSRANTSHERQTALNKFLYRIVKVDNMEWLEKYHVEKVIKAIEAMNKNKTNTQSQVIFKHSFPSCTWE